MTNVENGDLAKAVDAARAALAPGIVGLGLRIPRQRIAERKRKEQAV